MIFLLSKILPLETLYKTNVLIYIFKTVKDNYDDDLLGMLYHNSDFIHSILGIEIILSYLNIKDVHLSRVSYLGNSIME